MMAPAVLFCTLFSRTTEAHLAPTTSVVGVTTIQFSKHLLEFPVWFLLTPLFNRLSEMKFDVRKLYLLKREGFK
jgi:hypothetical protein